jgi:fatty acid desaturase
LCHEAKDCNIKDVATEQIIAAENPPADSSRHPDRHSDQRVGRTDDPPSLLGRGGIVPDADALPDVLPTDRLNERGMARPPLRDELRRTHDLRNAANVVSVWLQSFGLIALACFVTARVAWPIGVALWAVVFVLMGRAFALYAILGHEAAHRLLFSRRRLNDGVGRWGVAYPAFVPLEAYRRSHFAHHRDEFGPGEPDLNLYDGYPITKASFRRKLRRDALGSSGWKNLKGLAFAFRSAQARPVAIKIVISQLMVWAVLILIGGPARWWLYPLLWLAPWMTVWRVINRLRSIAEHGGMERSADRRRTTHVVRQSWSARFWIVPFNTGWHLAHHVDMGVPFQQLPSLHDELVRSGWVTETITYPNYRSLWKALASR